VFVCFIRDRNRIFQEYFHLYTVITFPLSASNFFFSGQPSNKLRVTQNLEVWIVIRLSAAHWKNSRK